MPEQFVEFAGHAQLPPEHTRFDKQTCAQKPQLYLSVWRSTHALPQRARPDPQFVAHAPLLHTWPFMQRLPHVPQLRGSLWRIVQIDPPMGPPAHVDSPAGQRQLPFVHVAPAGHWLPQLPQLPLLVSKSTHVVPMRAMHEVRPAEQPCWQLPLRHIWPRMQRLPHAPQLFGSVDTSVHWFVQYVCPPPHVHMPAVQLPPVPHAFAHAPQSNGSVWRLTHEPPQSVVPAPHDVVQWPAEQTWFALHTTPQPPQLRGSLCESTQTPLQRTPLL